MKISMYSHLTDRKLERLHNIIMEKYGKDLLDDSKPLEERKIINIAAVKTRPDKQEVEIHIVREFVKEWMFRKLKELALINYLSMEKRKNFDVHGEQRISVSFCRNIINIPNNREVTSFDMNRFRRVLDECDKRNGSKSGDDYQTYIENFSFEIFGKKYPKTNTNQVNVLLDLLDVDYYLFVPTITSFIFGDIEKSLIDGRSIFYIRQEYIRSPKRTLSIAAFVFDNGMTIRREACEVIFFNKWEMFYGRSDAERMFVLRHIDSAFAEGIKERALSFYSVSNLTGMLKIKDIFINEMKDGIIYHEIGHHISFADMIPIHLAFKCVIKFDGNVCHVLEEAMADYAPTRGLQKGTFARFVELAQTDRKQASANFYVYISDNWFLNEEEEDYMVLTSNALVALAMYFINTDGSVDFNRIANEHEHLYTCLQKRLNNIFDKLLDVIRHSQYEIDAHQLSYTDLIKEILNIIKQPNYEENEHQFDYSYLKRDINKEYQNSDVSLEELPKLETFINFWALLEEYLEKRSKTGWEQYQYVLNEQAILLEQMILKEIIKESRYKTLHEYIMERAKEIGIVKMPAKININAAVVKICEKLRLPQTARINALAMFIKIAYGKPYEISINYEGNEDSFIMVLQEMMLESGCGGIESGMFLGEYYDFKDSEEYRRWCIRYDLESLRDQIEKKMFFEINTLRVNNKFPEAKPMVRELLHSVTFLNGYKLADKIRAVDFAPLNSDALFEVFIPLKRGYMDWNTSQAIRRINQNLRPDDYIFQWTVDEEIMEEIVRALT